MELFLSAGAAVGVSSFTASTTVEMIYIHIHWTFPGRFTIAHTLSLSLCLSYFAYGLITHNKPNRLEFSPFFLVSAIDSAVGVGDSIHSGRTNIRGNTFVVIGSGLDSGFIPSILNSFFSSVFPFVCEFCECRNIFFSLSSEYKSTIHSLHGRSRRCVCDVYVCRWERLFRSRKKQFHLLNVTINLKHFAFFPLFIRLCFCLAAVDV